MPKKKISNQGDLVNWLDTFPANRTFEYSKSNANGRAGRKPAGAWAVLPRQAPLSVLTPGATYEVRPVGEKTGCQVCFPVETTALVVADSDGSSLATRASAALEEARQREDVATARDRAATDSVAEHFAMLMRLESERANTARVEAATLREYQGIARDATQSSIELSRRLDEVSKALQAEREDSAKVRSLTYIADVVVEKLATIAHGFSGRESPKTVLALILSFGPTMRSAAEQFISAGLWSGRDDETERFFSEVSAWVRAECLSSKNGQEEGEGEGEGLEAPQAPQGQPA